MPEYIGCRDCDSPSCRGCNIYTLATALRAGRFNSLMNEGHAVHITADVAEVVRCKDCIDYVKPSGERFGFCVRQDLRVHQRDYCSRGRLKGSRG